MSRAKQLEILNKFIDDMSELEAKKAAKEAALRLYNEKNQAERDVLNREREINRMKDDKECWKLFAISMTISFTLISMAVISLVYNKY